MQLNIYDLYKQSLDLINIEERGQLNLDRFNRFAGTAVDWFIDYMTGRLQEAQPHLSLLKTQKVGDLLFPIIKYRMVAVVNGIVPYPDDYNYLVDLRRSAAYQVDSATCDQVPQNTIDAVLRGGMGFRQVDVLSHDQISQRVNSHIGLLRKKDCAEQYQDGFRVYPAEGSCFMAYLIEPAVVKLAMTLDTQKNLLVYDKPNSVDPPFHRKAGPVLARKIAELQMGFVRESEGIQLTDAIAKSE